MIRVFLVHLARFMRVYLVACFASLLIVPLGFNLYIALVSVPIYSSDLQYFITFILATIVSVVYVFCHRWRVNSDDLDFMVNKRLRLNKNFIRHYFGFTGLLIHKIFNYTLPREQDSNFDREWNLCLRYIESSVASFNLQERSLKLALEHYKLGLQGKIDLEGELKMAKRAFKRGVYFREFIFISSMRPLMGYGMLGRMDSDFDYTTLFEHELIKLLGKIVLGSDIPINRAYNNRNSILLSQELFRLRRILQQQQQQQDSDSNREYSSYGNHYQQYSYTYESDPNYFKEEDRHAYSYRRSYKDTYKDTYERYQAKQQSGLTKLQQAYMRLELPDNADLNEVKKQYRKLTFKFHPDHVANSQQISESERQRLNERILELRQAYDFILQVFETRAQEAARAQ